MIHQEIAKAVIDTCRHNRIRDGYIGLAITRGIGAFGLDPENCKSPSIIIIAAELQVYPAKCYAQGLQIVTVPTTRNLHSSLDPAIKSLNYLNNILVKIETRRVGCEEAILLNRDGFVTECTGQNIFIVESRQLVTPRMMQVRLLELPEAS